MGLVKGALATILELHPHHAVVRLQGQPEDEAIWPLPRVALTYKPAKLPVEIVRHQIPLMLAWAATVHRVQGDDLERVVVDFRDQFFAHGQLETSESRVPDRTCMRHLVNACDLHEDEIEVTNVVIPQILVHE